MSLSNSKPKKQDQSKPGDGNAECDVLFGMKAISSFLGRSYDTVIRFMQDYDDFPVRRVNGSGYIASRTALNKWFIEYVSGKK